MDKLIKDSVIIKDMYDEDYTKIKYLFPDVDFDLLESYYTNVHVPNEKLLKLANDMNYLDCGKLTDVLIKIKHTFSKVDYSSLSPDLINEIDVELNKFIAIACGYNHSLALRKDGSIVTWGNNDYHQRNFPPNFTNSEYIAIACGDSHSVALRGDGTIITWGYFFSVVNCPINDGYIAIACGAYHSVALREDGSIVSWGDNRYHQQNNCPDEKDFLAIACGRYHSVGLNKNGTIVVWGNNNYQIKNSYTYVSICGGINRTVALTKDGIITSWGVIPSINLSPTPDNYVKIACAFDYSVALNSKGKIVIWENDKHSQRKDSPTFGEYIDIACGLYHFVALNKNGFIITWGNDEKNQRNDNPTEGGYIAIACGLNHSVALREDGTLCIWGDNSNDQRKDFPM